MRWTSSSRLVLLVGLLVLPMPDALRSAELESVTMRVVAGTGEAGFEDGTPGKFNKPIRLAPYGEGAVLVADIFNHAIRAVTRDGEVRTIAGSPDRKGHEDGPMEMARFGSPRDMQSPHWQAYRVAGQWAGETARAKRLPFTTRWTLRWRPTAPSG